MFCWKGRKRPKKEKVETEVRPIVETEVRPIVETKIKPITETKIVPIVKLNTELTNDQNYRNEISNVVTRIIKKLVVTKCEEERDWTLPIKLRKDYDKNICLDLKHGVDNIYNIFITLPINESPPEYVDNERPPDYTEINNNSKHDIFLEIGGIVIQKLVVGINVMKIPVILLPYNRILLYSDKDIDIRIEAGIYDNGFRRDLICKHYSHPYKINDTFQASSGVIEYINKRKI